MSKTMNKVNCEKSRKRCEEHMLKNLIEMEYLPLPVTFIVSLDHTVLILKCLLIRPKNKSI